MKRFNNEEIRIIKDALELQIDSLYEYSFRLEDEKDITEAKKYRKCAKEVEKVLKKI